MFFIVILIVGGLFFANFIFEKVQQENERDRIIEEIEEQKQLQISTSKKEGKEKINDLYANIESEIVKHYAQVANYLGKVKNARIGENFFYSCEGGLYTTVESLISGARFMKSNNWSEREAPMYLKHVLREIVPFRANHLLDASNIHGSLNEIIDSIVKKSDIVETVHPKVNIDTDTPEINHYLREFALSKQHECTQFFEKSDKECVNSIDELEEFLTGLKSEYNKNIENILNGIKKGDKVSIENFFVLLIRAIYIDPFFTEVTIDYRKDEKILVLDYKFPDLDSFPHVKESRYLKDYSEKITLLSQKALEDAYDTCITAICLRTMYEIFQHDFENQIELISFNGWVDTINKATGNRENLFILSIQGKKDVFSTMNIHAIEPKIAFRNLKGISASKISSLTPINPIMKINKEDSRFIEGYDVANELDTSTNLAAMDWQDFENLIREVFNKEFSINGGEVKITQASRDGGVDAIAFDPDPIRGGKIVIQAKRYTHTVDVSAVRDLHGTVQHEGANKGILVTTATFGPDSYEFVKNKPLTLIGGGELLYLLEKHGYSAKIDIREARKILNLKENNHNHRH